MLKNIRQIIVDANKKGRGQVAKDGRNSTAWNLPGQPVGGFCRLTGIGRKESVG